MVRKSQELWADYARAGCGGGTLFFTVIPLHSGNTHSFGVEAGVSKEAPHFGRKTPCEHWGPLQADQEPLSQARSLEVP